MSKNYSEWIIMETYGIVSMEDIMGIIYLALSDGTTMVVNPYSNILTISHMKEETDER